RPAIVVPPRDHAERARRDAVATAIAHVGLDVDRAVLGADDRAGRTGLEAAGALAVLAHIGHHLPRDRSGGPGAGGPLRERDVTPRRGAERRGVVVRHAGQVKAVIG